MPGRKPFSCVAVDFIRSPSPWIEWGQSFLFLAYGLVILTTGGDWLRGELFVGEKYDAVVMGVGVLSCLLSGVHAYGIVKEVYFIRSSVARASTLFWLTLLIYYYQSETHKIGTVMCLLWVLFNLKVYLWVAELKRQAIHGIKPRLTSWFGLQRIGHGYPPRADRKVVEKARRTAGAPASQGNATRAGSDRGSAAVGIADTGGLPSHP